jgi:hypothetical protein
VCIARVPEPDWSVAGSTLPQALIRFASGSLDELRLRQRTSCRGQLPSLADFSAVAQLTISVVVELARGPVTTRVHGFMPYPDFSPLHAKMSPRRAAMRVRARSPNQASWPQVAPPSRSKLALF